MPLLFATSSPWCDRHARLTLRVLACTLSVALLTLCLSPVARDVRAESRADTIFFATTAGLGLAYPDDAQFRAGPHLGALWEVTFGWGLTECWAVGVDFGTWQRSWLGLPFHYHNGFTPRLEWTPLGDDGLTLALASGLGTTDGVEPPLMTRHGVVVSPRVVYRWELARSVTIAPGAGVHQHFYGAVGGATVPFAVVELRVYGWTDGR